MIKALLYMALVAGLLLFSSCDPITNWTWEMQNRSTRNVVVEVYSLYTVDTIAIAAGQSAVIFETANTGRSSDPLYTAAEINDILVYANTDTAQRDYEDIQFWNTDTETSGGISKSYTHKIYIGVEEADF